MAQSNTVHAVGISYRGGRSRGYVVTRFELSGGKVVNAELVSPEPEAINFAAARLKSECAKLLQAGREEAECSAS